MWGVRGATILEGLEVLNIDARRPWNKRYTFTLSWLGLRAPGQQGQDLSRLTMFEFMLLL